MKALLLILIMIVLSGSDDCEVNNKATLDGEILQDNPGFSNMSESDKDVIRRLYANPYKSIYNHNNIR